MPKKIFRSSPLKELVEASLQTMHLTGLTDSTWFSKSCINLKALEELLPQLEPYYIPCKAKEYLHNPLTPARGLLIIRQLLDTQEITLRKKERSCINVKEVWYQIQKSSEFDKQIIVEFT
jgi:hypothetical protein